jgi:hypothetical protein
MIRDQNARGGSDDRARNGAGERLVPRALDLPARCVF